ncbi:MAG: 4-hydroxy-tetrahydrodipicolinate reductase [Clostridia bacterium]|nr:4-hydroxy-tetrahydrodipicolinate reductase [Clostridia bacterium]
MHIFIVGIGGKMGRAVCECAAATNDVISGGLDKAASPSFPTFTAAKDVNVPIDVLIDFSRPETLPDILLLADKYACPCVLCSTGYTAADQAEIQRLSKRVPVFQSENMSLGVNALSLLVEKAAAVLRGFDIEIVEKHHNQKADAPSGTAKLLCRAAERGLDYTPSYVYGREGLAKRREKEIGVHAVRGGTVVGIHEVSFFGTDETVTLSHAAGNRNIFANGALQAAHWLRSQPVGLYDMRDMIRL